MSANHARRHRTGHSEVTRLETGRARRGGQLVAIRDRLEPWARAYLAHDLPGAADLSRGVAAIEELIKITAPAVHAEHWPARVSAAALREAEVAGLCASKCAVCLAEEPVRRRRVKHT